MSTEPTIVRLGGKRVLLSGRKSEAGLYAIGFTPSPEPLLTKEAVQAFPSDPVVILEFEDLDAMQVLQSMVNSMIADKTKPSWVLVKTASCEGRANE
jgi:hypothetical protein